MNTIKQAFIEPFELKESNIKFTGAYAFSSGSKNLLLNKTGHIIILDDYLFAQLSGGTLPDGLAVKLLQRSFASIVGKEKYGECNDEFKVKPDFFMIDLTQKCNMQCKYCFRNCNSSNRTITETMTDGICDFIYSYCKRFDVKQITIQPWGGEPLLEYEKIKRMQDFFEQKELSVCFTIETNGLLLTDEFVQTLHKHKILIGVSLDGIEQVHDIQRVMPNGEPTHSLIIKNLSMLRKRYGDDFGTILTVTRYTIPYIEKALDYMAKDLKLRYIKVNFVHKTDFFDNAELCLSEAELRDCSNRIVKKIIELNETGYEILESNILIRLSNLLNRQKMSICTSRGCNGGKKMITFDFDGNIFPCELTDYPEEKIGHINEPRTLVDMVTDAMQSHEFFLQKDTTGCIGCPWHYFCRGGCSVHTKCNGLKSDCVDKIECISNKTIYPKLVKLILDKPETVNKMMGNVVCVCG